MVSNNVLGTCSALDKHLFNEWKNECNASFINQIHQFIQTQKTFSIPNLSFWLYATTSRLPSNPQITVFLAASETLLMMLHQWQCSFDQLHLMKSYSFSKTKGLLLKKHSQIPPGRVHLFFYTLKSTWYLTILSPILHSGINIFVCISFPKFQVS